MSRLVLDVRGPAAFAGPVRVGPDPFEAQCARAANLLAVDGEAASAVELNSPSTLFWCGVALLARRAATLPRDLDVERVQRLIDVFAALGSHIGRDGDRVVLERRDADRGGRVVLPGDDLELAALAVLAATQREGLSELGGAIADRRLAPIAERLNAMGATIAGVGTALARIDGGRPLAARDAVVGADAEEALFWLVASSQLGPFVVENVPVARVADELRRLERAAVKVRAVAGGLVAERSRTAPIDVTADRHLVLWLLVALFADGQSVVGGPEVAGAPLRRIAGELLRMGADLTLRDDTIVVRGGRPLRGATVSAPSVGAARVFALAALALPDAAQSLEPTRIELTTDEPLGMLPKLWGQS